MELRDNTNSNYPDPMYSRTSHLGFNNQQSACNIGNSRKQTDILDFREDAKISSMVENTRGNGELVGLQVTAGKLHDVISRTVATSGEGRKIKGGMQNGKNVR
jgi:hypothetical protein